MFFFFQLFSGTEENVVFRKLFQLKSFFQGGNWIVACNWSFKSTGDRGSWGFECVCSKEQKSQAWQPGPFLSCVPKSLGGDGGFVGVRSTHFVLSGGHTLQCLAKQQLNEIHMCACTCMYINASKLGINRCGSAGFARALPSYNGWHFGQLCNLWGLLNSSELLGI